MKSNIFSSKMHSISSKLKEGFFPYEQDGILIPVKLGGGRKFPK
jgi:hypothetical protein